MARGPLPDPNAIRRNKPTIPTTSLPAAGRQEKPPAVPAAYVLGEAGLAWWAWAWKTPQACGWSDGDLYVVARRAQLEDDLGALASVDAGLDLAEMLEVEDSEMLDQLRWLIERLKSLAASDLAVKREARELDDRLGLSPKGLAALRWKIVEDKTEAAAGKSRKASRYSHLQAVDAG